MEARSALKQYMPANYIVDLGEKREVAGGVLQTRV